MKKTIASIGIALTMFTLGATAASARSAKWSCVEVAPGYFVCTSSTSRP